MTKRLLMETTQIDPQKTVAEINVKLVSAGARQIGLTYDEHGLVTGLQFTLPVGAVTALFTLPARVEPVFKTFNSRRDSWNRKDYELKDRQQARRVAWRQLLRWVEAQLAMIETGMVSAAEVFLPYAQDRTTGKTLYERAVEAPERLLLPAPNGDE